MISYYHSKISVTLQWCIGHSTHKNIATRFLMRQFCRKREGPARDPSFTCQIRPFSSASSSSSSSRSSCSLSAFVGKGLVWKIQAYIPRYLSSSCESLERVSVAIITNENLLERKLTSKNSEASLESYKIAARHVVTATRILAAQSRKENRHSNIVVLKFNHVSGLRYSTTSSRVH
jgi:hypothetical protein